MEWMKIAVTGIWKLFVEPRLRSFNVAEADSKKLETQISVIADRSRTDSSELSQKVQDVFPLCQEGINDLIMALQEKNHQEEAEAA